jgi:hypothetical protein
VFADEEEDKEAEEAQQESESEAPARPKKAKVGAKKSRGAAAPAAAAAGAPNVNDIVAALQSHFADTRAADRQAIVTSIEASICKQATQYEDRLKKQEDSMQVGMQTQRALQEQIHSLTSVSNQIIHHIRQHTQGYLPAPMQPAGPPFQLSLPPPATSNPFGAVPALNYSYPPPLGQGQPGQMLLEQRRQ